jgi:hypothetical protein
MRPRILRTASTHAFNKLASFFLRTSEKLAYRLAEPNVAKSHEEPVSSFKSSEALCSALQHGLLALPSQHCVQSSGSGSELATRDFELDKLGTKAGFGPKTRMLVGRTWGCRPSCELGPAEAPPGSAGRNCGARADPSAERRLDLGRVKLGKSRMRDARACVEARGATRGATTAIARAALKKTATSTATRPAAMPRRVVCRPPGPGRSAPARAEPPGPG